MFPLTRILILVVAACPLGALAAASARAEDHQPTTVAQTDLNPSQIGDCHLLRRAISRHTCHVRLWEMHIETADK
jgi:hypothetical protein